MIAVTPARTAVYRQTNQHGFTTCAKTLGYTSAIRALNTTVAVQVAKGWTVVAATNGAALVDGVTVYATRTIRKGTNTYLVSVSAS